MLFFMTGRDDKYDFSRRDGAVRTQLHFSPCTTIFHDGTGRTYHGTALPVLNVNCILDKDRAGPPSIIVAQKGHD